MMAPRPLGRPKLFRPRQDGRVAFLRRSKVLFFWGGLIVRGQMHFCFFFKFFFKILSAAAGAGLPVDGLPVELGKDLQYARARKGLAICI
jgi:hypothetical protein